MSEYFPLSIDVAIVGTGLVESIVAAAASRIGKQVIHLDYRKEYGGLWGTYSLQELSEMAEKHHKHDTCTEDGTSLQPWKGLYNFTENWNMTESIESNTNEDSSKLQQSWTKVKIMKSRQFCIDILPKVIYSSGVMVELLINSGISRYQEFKLVADLYSCDLTQKHLTRVPCSRADVFKSTELSMIEKRLLMKNLTQMLSDNQEDVQGDLTFGEFLNSNKVEGKIRRHLVENVAYVIETESYQTAKSKIQKFVKSIGRYGDTPFLWPLYGSGNVPQCFCRCSAVYGGIYCLNQNVPQLVMDEDRNVNGITIDSKTITATSVVIESSLLPWSLVVTKLSRAILITNKPITPNRSIALINAYTTDGRSIKLFELPASSMACPQGFFVVHLIAEKVNSAQEDLEETVKTFYSGNGSESPDLSNVLWSSYFNLDLYGSDSEKTPKNLYSCSGPTGELDMDSSVREAELIFRRIFPDEKFLPRIPDPDEASCALTSEETETA